MGNLSPIRRQKNLDFQLNYSKYFSKQWKKYNKSTKNKILKKINILQKEPFRFKKFSSYRFTYKINIDIENKYSRLMYAVFYPKNNSIKIFGEFLGSVF